MFGSVATADDDAVSFDSLSEDHLEKLPAQEWTAEPKQATQAWADAKDEAERNAGIKPCCARCRTDSHTEAQCIAALVRKASERKVPSGEDSKPAESIRKKKTF